MKKINENDISQLNQILSDQKLYHKEIVSAAKLTSGNMNLTLRCKDQDGQSIIIKQGREFVEKYPTISAPIGRTSVEYYYYETIMSNDYLKKMSPLVHSICHDHQILIFEDLGQGLDGINFYQDPAGLLSDHLFQMIDYLANLHSLKTTTKDRSLENKKMRELNALHIFDFPFTLKGHKSLMENFPELKELSLSIINNKILKNISSKLKNLYFQDGSHLIHGDFYLGSLFIVHQSAYIIDPEFCFWGHKEFDLGVLIGHLLMLKKTKQECASLIDHYLETHSEVNLTLVNQYAGIEILRRIYGVAQLPFAHHLATIEHKAEVTDLALSLL